MNETYIKIQKFGKDIREYIGTPKMDEAFDTMFTEFEEALIEAMDWDHEDQYKQLYEYGIGKLLESIKERKQPTPKASVSQINLEEAMDNAIDDIKKDQDLLKQR